MVQTVEFDLKQTVLRNDTFGPRSIWYGAGLIGAIATFLFLSYYIKSRHLETANVSPSASIN